MNEDACAAAGDRRPIKTREKSWAKCMASRMAIWGVSPNGISVGGMVAGILAGCVFSATSWLPTLSRLWWLLGALLVQLRLLANMFDGMVAIESGRTSLVGELYNEIPDRISDAAIFAGLGWAAGGLPELGLVVAGLAVFVAYVRAMGKAAGAGNDFCGPMAKPQRMFIVTVTALFCGTFPVSCQTWFGRGLVTWMLCVVAIGCVATAWRRMARIAGLLREGGGNGCDHQG